MVSKTLSRAKKTREQANHDIPYDGEDDTDDDDRYNTDTCTSMLFILYYICVSGLLLLLICGSVRVLYTAILETLGFLHCVYGGIGDYAIHSRTVHVDVRTPDWLEVYADYLKSQFLAIMEPRQCMEVLGFQTVFTLVRAQAAFVAMLYIETLQIMVNLTLTVLGLADWLQ